MKGCIKYCKEIFGGRFAQLMQGVSLTKATRRQRQIKELYDTLGSLNAVVDTLGISYTNASKQLRLYRQSVGEMTARLREPMVNGEGVSHITERQRQVKEMFDRLGSQSAVARELGVSTVTVREKLIQYQRNLQRDKGATVLTLEAMSKGRICKDKRGRPSSIQLMDELENVHVLLPKSFDPQGDNDDEPGDEGEEQKTYSWRRNIEPRVIPPPASGVARGIVLVGQDATNIHEGLWRNIAAFEADLRSRSSYFERTSCGFTYNKSLFSDHSTNAAYFDPRLEADMLRNRLRLADAVDICGEMNTLPTKVNPLSGFHSYTEHRWGIFPHAKQHLESVARMKSAPYKANLTTGCVTLPNYVPKTAGLKAEYHHTLGFVIWEMTPDGHVWVRHITADPETGDFHDLDVKVSNGVVTRGHRVEAINYGDIHHEKLDPTVARATWGYDPEKGAINRTWAKNSLVERLKPKHQFFHDLSDFAPRNHHNVKDHLWRLIMARQRCDDVELELRRCSRFLQVTRRADCQSVVVQSNHDNALTRWLDNADFRLEEKDRNVLFFLRTSAAYYEQSLEAGRKVHIFEDVLRGFARDRLKDVIFICEDDSYVIAGDIECSQHGHLGPNGSRGGAIALSKMSPRMNIGHGHGPFARDGLWMAGVCNLDQGYNKGPSNWAIAHIVTHVDGSRQLMFMSPDGRFHA
jgi:hypothetical protein